MHPNVRRLIIAVVALVIAGGLFYVYWTRHQLPAGGFAAAGVPAAGKGGDLYSQVPIGVVTTVAEGKPWAVEVESLGTTRANEAVDLTTKTTNMVTAIRFDEGQPVSKGQVLVELDSAQVRGDLAAAQAALIESRSAFNRSRDLFNQSALSQAQLEQIEAALKANEARVASAEARLADTVIRAPFAGRAGLRRVSVGSLVNPGTVITTVDDTSVMKIDFDVPEAYLSLLAPGLEVAATSVAYPGRTFRGTVASVDSRVDPVTRSVKVRAIVPNDDGLLKQGMFVNVRAAREPTPAVTVPEQAIVPERGKVFVYVVDGGVAAKREITTGRRRAGEVEIVTGLRNGEHVVVEGTQKVRDGGPVTESVPAARQG